MVRDVLSSGDCHRNDTQCVQGTCTRTCSDTGETCGATGWDCENSLCTKTCNITSRADCHYSQASEDHLLHVDICSLCKFCVM